MLGTWRTDWGKRLENWRKPGFDLPLGNMTAQGYILMQHSERLSRPVKAYKKWADRIPGTYLESVMGGTALSNQASDGNCLAHLKHYRSLAPMAQEVRKPVFQLRSADGAIGSHSLAVRDAWKDFNALADAISRRIGLQQT
jgi:hypothetical protein